VYASSLAPPAAPVSIPQPRGFVKDDLGDKHGAIDDHSQAIAINPQYAFAYFNRGIAKSDLGDKQGAIDDYNQAIAINPKDIDFYINRGLVKFVLGDKQGAIDDHSQAIAIDPHCADAYLNRAATWQSLANTTQMCADLAVASRLGDSVAQEYFDRMCQ